MKHRILALALTVCLCLALTPPAFAQWTPPEDAPEAAAVYLENLDTGTVIYERNADEQRPIASLTKMMTCLLLAESGLDLDEILNAKVDQNAAKYPVEKARGSAAKYTELT